MKKDYAILGGLLLVGVIVWYFFSRSQAGQSGGVTVTGIAMPLDNQPQVYPNSQPIGSGNIAIGGSPINLTYNYAAPKELKVNVSQPFSTGSNKCDGCSKKNSCTDYKGANPVNNLRVSGSSLASVNDNFQGLVDKYSSSQSNQTSATMVPFYSPGGVLEGFNWPH